MHAMAMPAQNPDGFVSEWIPTENDDQLVTELVYQRYLELNAMEEALAERRENPPCQDQG